MSVTESIFTHPLGGGVPSNYSRSGALSTVGGGVLTGLAGFSGILQPSDFDGTFREMPILPPRSMVVIPLHDVRPNPASDL